MKEFFALFKGIRGPVIEWLGHVRCVHLFSSFLVEMGKPKALRNRDIVPNVAADAKEKVCVDIFETFSCFSLTLLFLAVLSVETKTHNV